jgi:hypothetical protein
LLEARAANDDGKTMAAWRLAAEAVPSLVTTPLRVITAFTSVVDGHNSVTDRPARPDVGGSRLTATVNGRPVAFPTVSVAVTEHLSDFVPSAAIRLAARSWYRTDGYFYVSPSARPTRVTKKSLVGRDDDDGSGLVQETRNVQQKMR